MTRQPRSVPVEAVCRQLELLEPDALTVAPAVAVLRSGSEGDAIETHHQQRSVAVAIWSRRLARADPLQKVYPGMRGLLERLEESASETVWMASGTNGVETVSFWFDDSDDMLGYVMTETERRCGGVSSDEV